MLQKNEGNNTIKSKSVINKFFKNVLANNYFPHSSSSGVEKNFLYNKLQGKIQDYAVENKIDLSKTFSNFLSLGRGGVLKPSSSQYKRKNKTFSQNPNFSNETFLKTDSSLKNSVIIKVNTYTESTEKQEETRENESLLKFRKSTQLEKPERKSILTLFVEQQQKMNQHKLSDNFLRFQKAQNENIKAGEKYIQKFNQANLIIKPMKILFAKISNKFSSKSDIEMFLEKSNNLKKGISTILVFLDENTPYFQYYSDYNEFFLKLIGLTYETKNPEIYLIVMLMHAKICANFHLTLKTLAILKQAKRISTEIKNFKIKMKCYKRLGCIFQYLRQYNKALTYFNKMLQIAWFLRDKYNEFRAYDYIGINYFYLQNIEAAKFFHLKMMKGFDDIKKKELQKLSNSMVLESFQEKTKRGDLEYNLPQYIVFKEKHDAYLETLLDISSDNEFSFPYSANEDEKIDDEININGKNFNKPKPRFFTSYQKKRKDIEKYHHIQENSFNRNFKPFQVQNLDNFNSNILLNHLTPNRGNDKYGIYSTKMNSLLKDDLSKLNKKVKVSRERLKNGQMYKLENQLQKLKINLNIASTQNDFYVNRIKGLNSRKGGVMLTLI